jgi:long-chain acyl-CoA synthetase
VNVVDYLMENQVAADTVALLTPSGEHSYGELRHAVDAVASFLIRSGAQKGDRVLLLADNSLFWVAAYLGTLRAGCVAVPLASGIGSEDLNFIVGSCAIRFGFICDKLSRAQLLVFPSAFKIVFEKAVKLPDAFGPESVSFEDVLASTSPKTSYPAIDEAKDLAGIMFTSGSTSKPRGVMISHRNIIANTASIVECLELTAQDRIMVVLPFYYCFGTSLLHTHLRVGGALVIDPRFMFPDKVLVRMQETRCTGFAGVPSHYQLLLRKSSFKKMHFPALRYVQQAGGKLADPLIRELREALPTTDVIVMYGQTEATARLSYLPASFLDKKLGSIGKGIPGTRLGVVNDDGMPVLPGQVGEIVAEGDNVALGYWEAAAEDSVAFRNGLLYTGDLATVDDDGFIFVVDRSKDILKCGGTRSSCRAVEDVLLEFGDLVEAAVIGVPDDLQGEAVKAFVVPRTKDGSLIERLHAFCVRRLPAHLIPKQIVILDELPKGSGGKILKPALRMVN